MFTGQVSLGKFRVNKVQQVFLFKDLLNCKFIEWISKGDKLYFKTPFSAASLFQF